MAKRDAADPAKGAARFTPKQQLFLDYYAESGDHNAAAKAAGYLRRGDGLRLLDPEKYPTLAIEARRLLMLKRKADMPDTMEVLGHLAKIMRVNPKQLYREDGSLIPMHELPDDVAYCVREFKVVTRTTEGADGEPVKVVLGDVKLLDKMDALKEAAKHLGLVRELTEEERRLGLVAGDGAGSDEAEQERMVVVDWDALAGSDGGAELLERRIQEEERKLLGHRPAPAPDEERVEER